MMRLILAFVFASALVVQSGYAQIQPEHAKRTYTDENDNLYIQKDLPLYLKISTSEDDKDGNILLKSKQSNAYVNPLYLDSEGLNTIRTPYAVDKTTKKTVMPLQDIVFEVYADGTAPKSRAEFNGAKKYERNAITFYGPDLRVSIFSKDGVSGVEDTYFSLDGSAFASYQQMLLMDKEGEHDLKFYSSDNVGNAEGPEFRKFIVDLTPPKTTYTITGPGSSNTISPQTVISLNSTDELSGVNNIKYYIDEGPATLYVKPIPFSNLADGDHKFTFYATDNVGNVEDNHDPKSNYAFYVDKVAPHVNATVKNDSYKNGDKQWVSPRSEVELIAVDAKSSVANIHYTLDQGGQSNYVSPFTLPNSQRLHTVFYYATDAVENRSQNFVLPLFLDNTPPTTSIRTGDPQFFARDTLFVNRKTLVTLTSKDNESGLQKVQYSINDGVKNDYSNSIPLVNEGFQRIKFSAIDNVNNEEVEKVSEFYVDATGPQIFVNFSIKAIGEKKDLQVYPNYTRMYIGATDEKCGTSTIKYSINGSPMQDYSSPYSLDVSEKSIFQNNLLYEVDIIASDKLGNESKQKVRFYIGG